jgi:hypothetical protein
VRDRAPAGPGEGVAKDSLRVRACAQAVAALVHVGSWAAVVIGGA